MTAKGVIYILTNPAFPEYVKIGYADNLQKRLDGLNNSSVPMHFRVYAVYEVSERLTDKKVHKIIDTINPDLRTRDNFDGKEYKREFYVMSAEDAFTLLSCIAEISGTMSRLKRMKPNGKEVLEEREAREIDENARRKPFQFSLCGIKPGDEISFVDDTTITAKVIDDKHVECMGEQMSLTALAKKLYKTDKALAGPVYFKYKGEVLSDLRKRMERTHE